MPKLGMRDDYYGDDQPRISAEPKPTVDSLLRDLQVECTAKGLSADVAAWLVREACRPPHSRGHEDPQLRMMRKDSDLAAKWAWPYRVRMHAALKAYKDMPEKDRKLLRAGVQDGVRWLGEPIEHYLDVVNETLRMREVGMQAYIQECKAKAAKLDLRMPR